MKTKLLLILITAMVLLTSCAGSGADNAATTTVTTEAATTETTTESTTEYIPQTTIAADGIVFNGTVHKSEQDGVEFSVQLDKDVYKPNDIVYGYYKVNNKNDKPIYQYNPAIPSGRIGDKPLNPFVAYILGSYDGEDILLYPNSGSEAIYPLNLPAKTETEEIVVFAKRDFDYATNKRLPLPVGEYKLKADLLYSFEDYEKNYQLYFDTQKQITMNFTIKVEE